MQVNNEQTNTQKMLEHNRMKEKTMQGSLQRSLVDVVFSNIDSRESTILNCKDFSDSTMKSYFEGVEAIESDADCQLIIKLKFLNKVDCNQLIFYPPPSSLDESVSNARTVKLFVNRNDIDFADVETVPPTAQFELPFDYENGSFAVPLAGAKFTRIQSLQLFVEDNFGTDATRLGRIRLDGFIAPSYHTEYK